jgi:hypothetical protein
MSEKVICDWCGNNGFEVVTLWTRWSSKNKFGNMRTIDIHNVCEKCAKNIQRKLSPVAWIEDEVAKMEEESCQKK